MESHMCGDSSSLSDTNYRLSKKVAQLTKVIVHLNAANENTEVDKKTLIDSHSKEIKVIRAEADSKINILQNEIKLKETALRDLTARSVAVEKESQKRLIATQNEANARESEFRARHEEELKSRVEEISKELSSQTKCVSDLLIKLEDSSQQHRTDIANLREQMKEENKLGLQGLRKELTNIHSQEMHCLKSQHNETTTKLKADALNQEKASVENAVMLVRTECDQKICQLMSRHAEKLKAIQTDAIELMNVETTILRGELHNVQVIAKEVPGLKARIDEHIDNENMLQAKVRMLQASLDSISSSNHLTITELKRENDRLRSDMRQTNLALDGRVKQTNDLMRRLAMIGDEKSSVESDLKQVVDKCRKMCEEIDEKNAIVAKRDVELTEMKQTQVDLSNELIHLSQYKTYVEQSYDHIMRLQTDLSHVKKNFEEMTRLYTSSQSSIAEWRTRVRALHFTEVTQLKDETTLLRVEIERLHAMKHKLEQSQTLSKADKETMEQRLKCMEQAAVRVANAHSGERLTWEKAIEELKVQHRKDKLHIQLVSQDEQDMMQNQIVQLESDAAKREEHYKRKYQILEEDFLHRVEVLNVALTKSKNESVIEIQKIAQKNTELQDSLSAEKEKCMSISRNNEELVRQMNLLDEKHQKEIETLMQNHIQEQEERSLDHAQLLQQLEEKFSNEKEALSKQLGTIKQEIHTVVNDSQYKIAKMKECAASVRQYTNEAKNMLHDLKCIRHQLGDTKSEWEHCKNEVSEKLRNMRQTCITIVNQEKMDAEFAKNEAFCKLNDSCETKVAAATKEAADAKKMLFQSIREYEMKLEREIRQLKEEHNLHLSRVVNESKEECGDLTSKLKNLHAKFEAVVTKQKDELTEKEIWMRQAETKLIDLTKLNDFEMRSVQSRHESERASLMRDILAKEALMEEKFAEERRLLQTALDEVSCQLKEAKEQLEQTSLTETQNEEQMKALKENLDALSSSEKKTREKMLFFQRELENRETNFNKRFSTASERRGIKNSEQERDGNAGVLRVIQNSSKINAHGTPNVGKEKVQKQQPQSRRQERVMNVTAKKVSKTKKTTTPLLKNATGITTESNRG